MTEAPAWLSLIWTASALLAGVGTAAFLIMLVRRIVLEALEPRRNRARRKRVRELVRIAADYPDAEPDSLDLPTGERKRLERAALDLIDQIAGRERDQLVRFLMAAGAMTRAISAMNEANPSLRQRTATLLGLFPDQRAESQLWLALGDPALPVRLAAASALLGREDSAVDLGELMRIMDRDGALTEAQTLLHGRQSALVSTIDDDLSDEARLKLFGLELFGGGNRRMADRILVQEMTDDSALIRATALRAVDGDTGTAVREAIVQAIGDPDETVCVEAAQAAGRLNITEAREALKTASDGAGWRLRQVAGRSLDRLDDASGQAS